MFSAAKLRIIIGISKFFVFFWINICQIQKYVVSLHPQIAQMAESVDALVSNTSGAIRAGSTPALGTQNLSLSLLSLSRLGDFSLPLHQHSVF